MKKIILILMIILMSSFASATFQCPPGKTCTVYQIAKPTGIMPDSKLYNLDVWLDNLKLKIFREPKTRLRIAEERMGEMQRMAEEEKTEYAEIAKTRYEFHINELEKKGFNIMGNLDNHIDVLNLVSDKLSAMDKSAESIENAIERSLEVKDRLTIRIEEGEILRDTGQTIKTQEEANKYIEQTKLVITQDNLEENRQVLQQMGIWEKILEFFKIGKKKVEVMIDEEILTEEGKPLTTEKKEATTGIYPIPTTAGKAPTGYRQI